MKVIGLLRAWAAAIFIIIICHGGLPLMPLLALRLVAAACCHYRACHARWLFARHIVFTRHIAYTLAATSCCFIINTQPTLASAPLLVIGLSAAWFVIIAMAALLRFITLIYTKKYACHYGCHAMGAACVVVTTRHISYMLLSVIYICYCRHWRRLLIYMSRQRHTIIIISRYYHIPFNIRILYIRSFYYHVIILIIKTNTLLRSYYWRHCAEDCFSVA